MNIVDNNNMWLEFLNESSKKTQNSESICIVLGDKNIDRKNILKSLYINPNEKEDKQFETNDLEDINVLSYSYFDIDDKYLESTSRVNIWSYDLQLFKNADEILQKSYETTDKMIIIIALDINNPEECIISLHKWLDEVSIFLQRYYTHERFNEDSSFDRKKLSYYLKHIRANKGDMRNILSNPDFSSVSNSLVGINFIEDYFNIPIIIVGYKSDLIFDNLPLPLLKKHRDLQANLRNISLDIGASLIYTSINNSLPTTTTTISSSSTNNNNNQVMSGINGSIDNYNLLKRYLIHRIYPEYIAMSLTIEDKLESTFIPSGFDTIDLINIASGLKLNSQEYANKFIEKIKEKSTNPSLLEKNNTSQNINNNDEVINSLNVVSISSMGSNEYKIDIENEQIWLDGLHQFIHQLSSSSSTSQLKSSNTSSSTNEIIKNNSSNTLTNIESTSTTNNTTNTNNNTVDTTNTKEDVVNKVNPTVSPMTRRSSVRTSVVNTEKKDVGDFFKNLLKK